MSIKPENSFTAYLKHTLTAHELEETLPKYMGWVDEKGFVRPQKRTHKLKSPRKWNWEEVRILIRFLNEKGWDGQTLVLNLAQNYGLGMDKITWAQGRQLEQEAAASDVY
jgi:hypothetical protein